VIARALPYACALLLGLHWHNIPLWVSLPTLLLCVYLVYADSKD
jgi:hypothetical protein